MDPVYREWVPSVFVGIKKDFTVYKNIKGNTEVLYTSTTKMICVRMVKGLPSGLVLSFDEE